jgi:uncharacterized protein YjbI with pentapeptide repeats
VNLSGCDMRKANLTTVNLGRVNLKGANLEGIKYDRITLSFLIGLDLNETRISQDLRKDIEKLRSKENF